MTEEKDAQERGWHRNNDDLLVHQKSDVKYVTLTGDTGQLYVKPLGEGGAVYEKYDPERHG